MDLSYTFTEFNIPSPKKEDKLDFVIPVAEGQEAGTVWDASIFSKARQVTLDVFATDESASVQVSLCSGVLKLDVDFADLLRLHCTRWPPRSSRNTLVSRTCTTLCQTSTLSPST